MIGVGCGGGLPPSAPSPLLGQEVTLTLPSDRGELVTLPLAGARATVLDAWTITCEPCREKLPKLWARRGEIESAGGKIVLVAVLAESEDTDKARATLDSWGVAAPFLVDRGDALSRQLGIDKLPGTVVIDGRGALRWVAGVDATATEIVVAARAVAAGP